MKSSQLRITDVKQSTVEALSLQLARVPDLTSSLVEVGTDSSETLLPDQNPINSGVAQAIRTGLLASGAMLSR